MDRATNDHLEPELQHADAERRRDPTTIDGDATTESNAPTDGHHTRSALGCTCVDRIRSSQPSSTATARGS